MDKGIISNDPLMLTVANGKLTANYVDQPLSNIFRRLRESVGLEYRSPREVLEYRISANFKDVALKQALGEILSPFNYCVVYDKDRQVYMVSIVSLKETHSEPRSSSAPPTESLPGPPQRVLELGEKHSREKEERRRYIETRDEIVRYNSRVASDTAQEPPQQLRDLLEDLSRKFDRNVLDEDESANSQTAP